MATKKRAKRRRVPGDSPITVGGGGGKRARDYDPGEGRIKFDRNDYAEDGDVWSNSALELESVTLNKEQIPGVSKRTGIVITYRRGVFPDNIIRINEGRMGVRFFQDHFPYDPDQNQQQHHGRAEITGFRVGVKDIELKPGKVEIVAHTKFKRRSAKPNKKRPKSTARRK